MIEVKVINKIGEKIEEYQNTHGSSKAWIARQMEFNSRQAFDKAVKNASHSVETYARFAYFFNCDITDLFEIKYVEDSN